MNYHAYFDALTPEKQNEELLRLERSLERMAAKKAKDGLVIVSAEM
jgi:hypothetical protein